MNGIENITARISDQARSEIVEIKKDAEAECEKIKARYRELAQEEYWTIVTKGKQDADKKTERIMSTAQTEAKKQMLALKQEMLSKSFSLAKTKILKLSEKKYVDFLVSLAVAASRNGKEQLVFSPADRNKVGKKVAASVNEALSAKGIDASVTIAEESRPISGGLILKDGSIEINCSIDTIIETRKNKLSGEVAKMLFE